jgi:hypothetical protein
MDDTLESENENGSVPFDIEISGVKDVILEHERYTWAYETIKNYIEK